MPYEFKTEIHKLLPDEQENIVESKFEADRWNFEILEE